MELKDLVLSTLKELDEKIENERSMIQKSKDETSVKSKPSVKQAKNSVDEVAFLKHAKERLIVLFEGLQSQEIHSYEQKLELTMQYLQLHLAHIEQRLEGK